jgi:uncharacterized RDD family membrane protein YckC
VPWVAPIEATGPARGLAFSPHGARLVAYILDSLVILAIYAVLFIPLLIVVGRTDRGDQLDGPAVLAVVLVFLGMVTVSVGYFPFFWARGGQTPGMRPFRLRVVRDRDGAAIGWGTAWLRLLGLYVACSVFYLGLIWIFVDKRRRGWHDLIASTVVIQRVDDPGRQEG